MLARELSQVPADERRAFELPKKKPGATFLVTHLHRAVIESSFFHDYFSRRWVCSERSLRTLARSFLSTIFFLIFVYPCAVTLRDRVRARKRSSFCFSVGARTETDLSFLFRPRTRRARPRQGRLKQSAALAFLVRIVNEPCKSIHSLADQPTLAVARLLFPSTYFTPPRPTICLPPNYLVDDKLFNKIIA